MNQAYSYAQPMDLAQSRAAFIRRTYSHVAGAVLVFAALLSLFVSIDPIRNASLALLKGKLGWILIIVAYMAAGWVANKMAHDFTSKKKQYAGLGIFVLLEALIFTPLMAVLLASGQSGILPQAVILTAGLFLALSSVVFITRHSFSWLRSVVTVGMIVALAVMLASAIFGFSLGFFFIALMVVLMAAAILFTTGQVANEYPEWAYVGGALALFSALTGLFWYVIQLLLSLSND